MFYQIPANHRFYNHHQSFIDNGFIDWVMYNYDYEIGDIVYIYSAKPISALSFKCVVERINIDFENTIDDEKYWIYDFKNRKKDKYVRLRLINAFSDTRYNLTNLRKNGLRGKINTRITLSGQILEYIESVEQSAKLNNDFLNEFKLQNDKKTNSIDNINYNLVSMNLVKHKFEKDKDLRGTAYALRNLIEKKYDESKIVNNNYENYSIEHNINKDKSTLKGREKMNVMFYHLDKEQQDDAHRFWGALNSIIHNTTDIKDYKVSTIDAAIKFFESVLIDL
jgi:hypothetical protein